MKTKAEFKIRSWRQFEGHLAVWVGGLLLFALPIVAQAQFTYTTNNGTVTITGYTGPGGAVTIPSTINGLPVTSIGYQVFAWSSLTSVRIPYGVTNIGYQAFWACFNLTAITVNALNPPIKVSTVSCSTSSRPLSLNIREEKPEATRFRAASSSSGTTRFLKQE
jgi:BspA type Leucine rich repeat region (6 copies)